MRALSPRFAAWPPSVLGVGAALLVAELICRVLPVSTSTAMGYYFDANLLVYPPHHAWTTSTGWDLRNAQRMRSNNFGFAAERDFVPDANAIALIGDSFVEASMLDAADRPVAQLQRALGSGGRPVYAMGGPGSSLLDYAERIRFSRQRLGVKDIVVMMERGDVMQAFCGSGNVHAACLDARTFEPKIVRQPDAGAVKRALRHSALAQYLSQLKVSPSRLWAAALAQARPAAEAPELAGTQPHAAQHPVQPTTSLDDDERARVDAVTNTFLQRVLPLNGQRIVIVIDSDRDALRTGARPADPARARFMALARAAGIVVVDTEPVYAAHFAASPTRLDVGPYDHHLNALGVSLAMKAAAAAMATALPH